MEDMIEQYGQGCLWLLSGAGGMMLFLSLLQEDGIIREMVQQFIFGICG